MQLFTVHREQQLTRRYLYLQFLTIFTIFTTCKLLRRTCLFSVKLVGNVSRKNLWPEYESVLIKTKMLKWKIASRNDNIVNRKHSTFISTYISKYILVFERRAWHRRGKNKSGYGKSKSTYCLRRVQIYKRVCRSIRVFLLVTVKQRLKKRCISVKRRFNNFSNKILQVEGRIFIAMFGFVVETLNYSITPLYNRNLINKTKKFSSYRRQVWQVEF